MVKEFAYYDLVCVKKNVNEDHPLQGKIIKIKSTISDELVESNKEKNDYNNSISRISSKHSKHVKSQNQNTNSSITYFSVMSKNITSKNSNAPTDDAARTINLSSSLKK